MDEAKSHEQVEYFKSESKVIEYKHWTSNLGSGEKYCVSYCIYLEKMYNGNVKATGEPHSVAPWPSD